MSEVDASTSATSSSASGATQAQPSASTPSPASSSGDKAAPSPSATDSPSPSSSDEKNIAKSDREGLLAAVRSVVKTVPEKPAVETDQSSEDEFGLAPDKPTDKDGVSREPAAPPADGTSPEKTVQDQTQQVVADDPNLPDPTEDELAKLRPGTRKRFERILAQRNQARRDLDALKPEIDQHRQLQGYLRQNQLAPDDVNQLLGVGAALRRGDFQAFLTGVAPYVTTAQEALGLRLPNDLQSQVDQGLITVEHAAEMSRMRYRVGQAEHRVTEQSAAITRQTQETILANVRTAVDNWEAHIRTRDPDYPQKAVAVRRFAQALLQERGTPRDAQEALGLIQNAYDEASRELARARPAPKPTRQVPTGNQGSTVAAAREPQTMKEAALRALNGMRKAV